MQISKNLDYGKGDMDVMNEKVSQQEKSALRLILSIHYEESVCDERARRILERVVIMINEGRFD